MEKEPSFIFQKEIKFNSKSFQQFLEHILEHFGKVCLILDRVAYHRAKKLQPFLEENKNRLWIHLLPPYSPEFNAIEGVWKITRKDATHNRYFPTMKRLTRAIQTRFRLFQSERWRLSGIIANFL